MPAWLAWSEQLPSVERLREFLRRAAEGAPAQEVFRYACETLQQLFEADSVVLCRLSPAHGRLEVLAASTPDWELLGELALDTVPEWQAALDGSDPVWIDQVATRWHPLPSPLLGTRRALVLPVRTGGQSRGCFLAAFGQAVSSPATEELETGLALVYGLGVFLETQALRSERDALQSHRESLRRLAGQLRRLGSSDAALNHLAGALLEFNRAQATGVYERQATGFRRLAAAGAAHLLPEQLPRGEGPSFPWERALNRNHAFAVSPAAMAPGLERWLPQLARARLSLHVQPLRTREAALGVLLVCGPRLSATGDTEEAHGTLLSLLTAALLDQRRRRRAEEECQCRYQALFDRVEQGVFFLDSTGRLLAANPTLVDWTGFSLSELQQRSLADFLSPSDWEPLAAWLDSRAGGVLEADTSWRTKAGDPLVLHLSLSRLPNGVGESCVLVLARDAVRARKMEAETQAELSSQLNEVRLQGLLDSLQEGVWLIGPDQRAQLANHRLGQLFGLNPQQLAGGAEQCQVLERLKPHFQSPEVALARWDRLHTNPEQVSWDELEMSLPARRVLECFARPLFDSRQQFVGRLEIYRDITAQRLLEDKVVQRERLAVVGQLVSGIAHELNNPLTAVAGYAQLLLASSPPAELREKAERLCQEAERAGRIVKNLLLFARGAKAEKQAVELMDIVERTLSFRAYEFKVENIRVVREYAPDVPRVLADPHQLQQVFLNLLLNAEQAIHSQRDHGRVTLRIRTAPGHSRVRVEIADDGPGIPASLLPHIFEPFFTTKAPQQGTGLGLSISQTIVKEHGGEIFVHSEPGSGSTFIVEFPALREGVPEPRPQPRQQPHATAPEAVPRILVVDDEPAVAHLIADALRQEGYAVSVHTESRRALAEAVAEPFRLAICDIRMPELDGQAFHRALREHQPALARRLLFTTGDTLARETAEFLEEVRLPYLAKPFRVEELRSAVRRFLSELESSALGEEAAALN